MKVLSIETSSKICSVAILEDKNLVKKIELNNGLTHSETLMPLIKQILEETNLILPQIDLLVCDIGPGSFTGIRIGISTIKAFADSLNIKAIGINSLEALSYHVKTCGLVCSLLDAKKDNVYCEIFEHTDESYFVRRIASFENIEHFLLELQNLKLAYPLTFVGNGAIHYKEKILKYLPNSKFTLNHDLSAIYVGKAGMYHYQNEIISNLEPLYLRKSEAEQKWEEKQNGNHQS